jgi:hypothetical protein
MISHPRKEAELFKERFTATWAGSAHPFRDVPRAPLLIRTVFVCNVLASVAALLGAAAFFFDSRLRVYAVPATVFPIVLPFAFYLSQALLRYRYPIDPMVLLLAATGVAWLIRRMQAQSQPVLKAGRETFSAVSSSV